MRYLFGPHWRTKRTREQVRLSTIQTGCSALLCLYLPASGLRSWRMTENAVKQAFYRFRQRYQTLLREEIAHTVAMPGDVEDELRYLISVVRT